MHLLIITCLLYKEKDKCFVALFLGGAWGKPAPRRAPVLMILLGKCPWEFGKQCHKYYGVSCGAATTKTAAKPPVSLCDSKAYSSRQGAKKQPPIPHMKMWYRGLLSLSAPLMLRIRLAAIVRGCRETPHPLVIFLFSNSTVSQLDPANLPFQKELLKQMIINNKSYTQEVE